MRLNPRSDLEQDSYTCRFCFAELAARTTPEPPLPLRNPSIVVVDILVLAESHRLTC